MEAVVILKKKKKRSREEKRREDDHTYDQITNCIKNINLSHVLKKF